MVRSHIDYPIYLRVKLDSLLTYNAHYESVSKNIDARNNPLKKLVGARWGIDPKMIRTSGFALYYSVGEYACPVWRQSSHAKKVDISLNDMVRLITGCLKLTLIEKVQILSGIAPPEIRREIPAKIERGNR